MKAFKFRTNDGHPRAFTLRGFFDALAKSGWDIPDVAKNPSPIRVYGYGVMPLIKHVVTLDNFAEYSRFVPADEINTGTQPDRYNIAHVAAKFRSLLHRGDARAEISLTMSDMDKVPPISPFVDPAKVDLAKTEARIAAADLAKNEHHIDALLYIARNSSMMGETPQEMASRKLKESEAHEAGKRIRIQEAVAKARTDQVTASSTARYVACPPRQSGKSLIEEWRNAYATQGVKGVFDKINMSGIRPTGPPLKPAKATEWKFTARTHQAIDFYEIFDSLSHENPVAYLTVDQPRMAALLVPHANDEPIDGYVVVHQSFLQMAANKRVYLEPQVNGRRFTTGAGPGAVYIVPKGRMRWFKDRIKRVKSASWNAEKGSPSINVNVELETF